ncbi:MAG: acyl carrier protein [Burkholderiales bacterium]
MEHLGITDDAKVTGASSFIDDLGADSLDNIELVMAFEEEFYVAIADAEAENILTFDDVVRAVCIKLNITA